MWNLPLPAEPAGSVYLSCITGVRDKELKNRLGRAAESVAIADLHYREAGTNGGFGRLRQADFDLPDVTAKEMTWLYESRMVGKQTPGRPRTPGRLVYDAIRTASPQGRCPPCGHRDVTTVDHYLPKSAYAALAVNPANLIPACSDCNKTKSNAVLGTLHPYYDNIEQDPWLSGFVMETSPPVVQFSVQPPDCWPSPLAERVQRHFDTFSLGRLYSMQAARELIAVKGRLGRLLRDVGLEAVRDHLREDEESRRKTELNSWQAAFYGALAASYWFCAGGFNS